VGGVEPDLICFRMSNNTLTDVEKDQLLLRVKDIAGLQNEQVNTALLPDVYVYKAWHIGPWNRYAWAVSN
jgi:hypothetical protein